jgi:hypothetical protein
MYYQPSTGQKFFSHSAIRRTLKFSAPTVMTDEYLIKIGFYPVKPESVDYDQATQKVVSDAIIESKGQYIEKKTVVDLTPEEIDANKTPADELRELKKQQGGKQLTLAYLDKRMSVIEKILGAAS